MRPLTEHSAVSVGKSGQGPLGQAALLAVAGRELADGPVIRCIAHDVPLPRFRREDPEKSSWITTRSTHREYWGHHGM